MNFDPLVLICVALGGLLFGSFNTVLCYRIPREIPLGLFSHQRSRCPGCDKVIPWYRNIPVFSYLFLRGKCGDCGYKIPLRYLLIELSTFLIFVVTYLVYDNSVDHPVERFAYWAELVKLLLFALALVSTVFIDLEFRIIPDRFSIGGWIVALVAALAWSKPDLTSSIAGGVFGAGSFWLMAWAYEKFKGVEGLGFGDVKMMGWLGSWVGFFGVPFVILCASISGLVAGVIAMRKGSDGMKTAIPFGPFLALGGYSMWVLQSLGLWNG